MALPDPAETAEKQHRPPAPVGTRWAWRPDDRAGGLEWSTDPDKIGELCRFAARKPACPKEPAAVLNRSSDPDKPRWWTYCADHLFGRALDDGVIYALFLEEVPTDG